MAPLGLVGQIYLVSAAIGSIYLAIGVALGQAHGAGHGGAAHGLSHGGAGAHGLGHGLSHGTPSATPHAISAGSHGTQLHSAQGDVAGHIGQAAGTAGHQIHAHLPGSAKTQPSDQSALTQIVSPSQVSLVRFILSSLSPFSLSVFMTFFGISGLFIYFFMPALGFWTMPAACIISFVITRQVLFALSLMVAKMHVSSEAREEDIIGQIATVCLSIKAGHVGEVTYVVGASLYNSPARARDNKTEFKKGSKVIICELRDNVVYVEPLDDIANRFLRVPYAAINDYLKQTADN